MVDVFDVDDLDPTAGLLAHRGFVTTEDRTDDEADDADEADEAEG